MIQTIFQTEPIVLRIKQGDICNCRVHNEDSSFEEFIRFENELLAVRCSFHRVAMLHNRLCYVKN